MRVLIAGSHGQIGQRLVRRLTDAGHDVVAMIRDEGQADELRALGAEPLVADLAEDVGDAPKGCDAVVFAAGAGPGSGPEPKKTIDRDGARKLVDAAGAHGAHRYVMVSSIGAHDPSAGGESMEPYLQAKQEADAHLASSDLAWTIVRPGSLTDDEGDGLVRTSTSLGERGPVTRDDVAATLAAVLERNDLAGVTFELFDGDTPIEDALDGVAKN